MIAMILAQINFDWTVKLGDVLTIISFLGIGIAAYFDIRSKLSVHSLRLTTIEDTLKNTQGTVTQLAVQDTRLNNMESDIRDLRHGKGFITEGRGYPPINREYGPSGGG